MKTKPRPLYFFSAKFIPNERRFFWALAGEKSLLEGRCLDTGFASDVADALAAARANPAVGRGRLELLDGAVAFSFYAFIWLKSPPPHVAVPTPEDRSFEAERFRELARRCEPAPPPKPAPAGHRGTRSPPARRRTARPQRLHWSAVLGTSLPCTEDEVRSAFRAQALKVVADRRAARPGDESVRSRSSAVPADEARDALTRPRGSPGSAAPAAA